MPLSEALCATSAFVCVLLPHQCPCLQGLAGLSIQWGAWAEGGMAAANAATAKAVERLGMGMIAPDQGVGAIQALLLLLHSTAAQSVAPLSLHLQLGWPLLALMLLLLLRSALPLPAVAAGPCALHGPVQEDRISGLQ